MSERQTSGETSPEVVELRTVLTSADRAVRLPDGLAQRLLTAGERESPKREAAVGRWWRGLRGAAVARPALAAVAVAVVLLLTVAVLDTRWSGGPTRRADAAGGPVTLTVYNVEQPCQHLRTMECALTLAKDPKAPYSVAAGNGAGYVWHGDRLVADCVTTEGLKVVDEQGMSSSRWYHVTVPGTGATGWLPGVRTRNLTDIPQCGAP